MREQSKWVHFPSAYPALFSAVEPPSFECGAGWIEIVSILCQRIMTIKEEKPGLEITIDRVKEKFGMLRIHFRVHGVNPEFRAAILESVHLASNASARCCEMCGAIGRSYLGPPNKVRCDDCIDL